MGGEEGGDETVGEGGIKDGKQIIGRRIVEDLRSGTCVEKGGCWERLFLGRLLTCCRMYVQLMLIEGGVDSTHFITS
jgi:hypothetical protein